MKTIKYLCIAALAVGMTACKYDINPDKLYLSDPDDVTELTADGKLYTLNEFLDAFMTEEGNYLSDTSLYRKRATNGNGIYLFSIDTIPSVGPGIYIRGRVSTDDYGGNFYKSLVIQEVVEGEGGKKEQQNLRVSIDMGSASGMYPRGQEILIRCNGLAIGRYSNQPQLCVPSYNNNALASSGSDKVGWTPGRIPAPLCRKNFHLIGTPDETKLKRDTLTIAECLKNTSDVIAARKTDGRLVVVEGIWFDGTEDNYGTPSALKHYVPTANPQEEEKNESNPKCNENSKADVFAPSTGNVGYPQGRYVTDGPNRILVSTSEYAKYANFYLPYEWVDDKPKYGTFTGSVQGILGFYWDNALRQPSSAGEWVAKWSITICDLSDLKLTANGTGEVPFGTEWGLYTRPSDGKEIDLRKEWQEGKESKSILVADNEL